MRFCVPFVKIEAAKKARCHEFITKLPQGYDTVLGEGGGTLSGGERQRLSIARAIMKDAPVIILDEATASLDSVTEEKIDQAIRRRGCSCLIAAHRLSTIRDCDEILVLAHGKIADRGTHEELMRRCEEYRRLMEAETEAEHV